MYDDLKNCGVWVARFLDISPNCTFSMQNIDPRGNK